MSYNSSYMGSQSDSRQTANVILADENSFYYRFERDLAQAKHEVIIESPFITVPKLRNLKHVFESLMDRKIAVFIITRHPEEHDSFMAEQAEAGIQFFEKIGVQVFMSKTHHRKLAMIDRRIVWKGSLNILSHKNSRELMEREDDEKKAKDLFSFLKYDHVREIQNICYTKEEI